MSEVRGIESRQPSLKEKEVWCSMNGLTLYIEGPPGETTQSKYYNGWTQDFYITNVFGFNPDGTIPVTYFNIPGCVHDRQYLNGEIFIPSWRLYLIVLFAWFC